MLRILLLSHKPSIHLRSFCSAGSTDKLNKLNEKLNKDSSSPNSPLGMMDRIPKKEVKVEQKNEDPHAKFPNNVNPITGEINGPTGPEPTRYGDWEKKGRCSDF